MKINVATQRSKREGLVEQCVKGILKDGSVYVIGFDVENSEDVELIIQLSENREYLIVYSNTSSNLRPFVYHSASVVYLSDIIEVRELVEEIVKDFFMQDNIYEVFPIEDIQVSAKEII